MSMIPESLSKNKDYIPIVSTVSSARDIYYKCFKKAVEPKIGCLTEQEHYYYEALDKKSFTRCFTLLIPVLGNCFVGMYDAYHDSYKQMSSAIEKNPLYLKHVSTNLKQTTNIALKAIGKDPIALQFVSKDEYIAYINNTQKRQDAELTWGNLVKDAIAKNPQVFEIPHIKKEFGENRLLA